MTGTDPNSKNGRGQPAPPRWTRLLLNMLLPAHYRDQQLGDLSEGFHARGARGGYAEARRWYRRQVLISLGPAVRLRIRHRRHVFGDLGEGSVAMLRDLRLALRGLIKRPLFTVFAVLSVTIGIGVATAASSIVNAFFGRTQPGIVDPDRMVDVLPPPSGRGPAFSYPDFLSLQSEVGSLSAVAGARFDDINVGVDAGRLRVYGMFVSADYFDVVGVVPAQGRFFGPEVDEGIGEHPVAVVTHQFWQNRLGSDPDVIGSTLRVEGESMQIIGVAPPAFSGHMRAVGPEIWLPIMQLRNLRRSPEALTDRGEPGFTVIGRLAPDGSLERAQAEADALFVGLGEQFPESYGERRAGARIVQYRPFPVSFGATGPLGVAAVALSALVGLVLLVTASNVAGMLLARSAGQGREVAVRMALGASRARLVAYLLAETLVLFFMGGLGGVFVAWVGTRALDLGALPLPIPVQLDFSPDGKVVGGALALALLTGCIFGVGPALWATKSGVAPLIKTGAGPARARLRRLFVGGQVAMSLVLVSAGLIFLRSAQRAAEMPRGFQTEGRYSVTMESVLAWDGTADEARVLLRDAFDQIEGNNLFRAVAISSGFPLDGTTSTWPHFREGTDDLERRGGEQVHRNIVSPGYLRTLGIPVLEGRAFDELGERGSPTVAMVNQAYAERYGGGERVIGRRFRTSPEGQFLEIVGVVANVPDGGLRTLGSPMIYLPMAQDPQRRVELVVWEREGAEGTPATLTRMLREANPELALTPVRSLEEVSRLATFDQRAGVAISSALALVGLLLSGLGLYGVVAFRVSNRRKEIGIRMALGAGQELVRKQVLWDGMKLAMPGVLLGVLAATALARLLRSLLYGVGALDPVPLVGVAVLGFLVVGLASYGPARKASAIDPGVALRLE